MDQETIDQSYLSKCLDLARTAGTKDEVPVGAMVVNNQTGEIVAKSFNLRETLNTPLAHAEIIAIHRACKKLGSWRLTGHTLYTSLEPCVMCAGTIIQCRIDRVVYSATDIKGGGQSLFQLFDNFKLNHKVDWKKGAFEADNQQLLKDFFKGKRLNKKGEVE